MKYTLNGTAGCDDPDTGDTYRGLYCFGKGRNLQKTVVLRMYKNCHIYIAVALAWAVWKYLLHRFPPETAHPNKVEFFLGLTALVTIPLSLLVARVFCHCATRFFKVVGVQKGKYESDT